tara:strand:+ start:10321 stop:10869 length:549 start_codon:yes stop_codon:yes gene_type:complete
MIRESIVITTDLNNKSHIAPMGVIFKKKKLFIAPYVPSKTYDNLIENPYAVINFTDDVNIFVDALLKKKKLKIKKTKKIKSYHLVNTLSYLEIKVENFFKSKLRPRFQCKILKETNLNAFKGFNRAQLSIIEAAILVSRINILPLTKIKKEINYLQIAVDKTAGINEKKAWNKLIKIINNKK